MQTLRRLWDIVKPYTRKAWAALLGVGISWLILVLQDSDLAGLIGRIPDLGPIPLNSAILALIPFAVLWLAKEKAKLEAEPAPEVPALDTGP